MLTLKQRTMLGDIPDDWDDSRLRKMLLADFPGEWGDERGPHMAPVLRSTNLTNDGRLDPTDIAMRALPPEKVKLLSPCRGDILVERSGGGPDQPVGRVGMLDDDMPGHAFSNFLHLLRPDGKKVNPRFLGWVLFFVNKTGRILRLEQQTTQMRNLHFRDYLSMSLPLPPAVEQATISLILDKVDSAIIAAIQAAERSRDVKRSLRQHLFAKVLLRFSWQPPELTGIREVRRCAFF